MESKYNNLMTEHEDVVKQLSQMATEKGKLEQEVVYLRNLLKNNSQISEGVQRRHLNARNLKKATVCMMIMFLSFGLIFQSESLRNNLSRDSLSSQLPRSMNNNLLAVSHPSHEEKKSTSEMDRSSVVDVNLKPIIYTDLNGKKSRKHSVTGSNTERNQKRARITNTLGITHVDLDQKPLALSASKAVQKPRIQSNTNNIHRNEINSQPIRDGTLDNLPVNNNNVNALDNNIQDSRNGHIALLIPSSLFSTNVPMRASDLEISYQVLSYYTWPSLPPTTENTQI
eukprot:TRINITY_DN2551_c0_g1_i1.p1 TRINITY_DN2551_c0_g1~~TRINITY_DN2551_c0_g1_i1.p1  ORF type:complete len:284 (-),score=32.09 TRINITY_DN2551_c0_g1_i1:83-934(-)